LFGVRFGRVKADDRALQLFAFAVKLGPSLGERPAVGVAQRLLQSFVEQRGHFCPAHEGCEGEENREQQKAHGR
jgi:hypothetical protein